jgi:predicted TIM-barrel fold metal-dependent hydrolase
MMEDPRVQHPLLKAPTLTPAPLIDLLKETPSARVQLLNSWHWTRLPAARALLAMENVTHDISGLEGVGAIGRMLEGNHWYLGGKVAVDRVLFGSHAPYFPIETALIRMFESPLNREQRVAIMATNARRLLGKA